MTVMMATEVGILEAGEEFMISTRKTVYRLLRKKVDCYLVLNTQTNAVIGLLGKNYPVRLIVRDDAQLQAVFERVYKNTNRRN